MLWKLARFAAGHLSYLSATRNNCNNRILIESPGESEYSLHALIESF